MPYLPDMDTVILIYLAIISIISVIVTVKDKYRAIKNGQRTPERTLLLLSALGGSVAMLMTMMLIRHKTQHVKFMLGIPLIMLLQVGVLACLIYLGILA